MLTRLPSDYLRIFYDADPGGGGGAPGGDGGAGGGAPAGGAPAGGGEGDEPKFTQAEVDRMMGRTRNEARTAAANELAESLGVSVDEAKAIIEAKRQADDAAKDETTKALCASVGKVAVSCGDRAGFIVNCLLFPYLNDAVTLAETGVDLTVIDDAIKAEAGFPMGPFQLLDGVGNDVSLAIQQELLAEFKEPGFTPAALLEQKVAEGALGRKTGKGFHDYS